MVVNSCSGSKQYSVAPTMYAVDFDYEIRDTTLHK